MIVLPILSKVCERVIYEQASNYLERFFNKILCGLWKIHSTQYDLFKLLTSWQNSLIRGGFVGSFLMDLSKGYDCLKGDIFLDKFQAYSFSEKV